MRFLIEALRVYGLFGSGEWVAVSIVVSLGIVFAVVAICMLIFASKRKPFFVLLFFSFLLPALVVFTVSVLRLYLAWRYFGSLTTPEMDGIWIQQAKFFVAMMVPALLAIGPGFLLSSIGLIVKGRTSKMTATTQTRQQFTAVPAYVS